MNADRPPAHNLITTADPGRESAAYQQQWYERQLALLTSCSNIIGAMLAPNDTYSFHADVAGHYASGVL